jgi:Txe/YoeB family toxin of Txe-Axe toxin-antitoxin module
MSTQMRESHGEMQFLQSALFVALKKRFDRLFAGVQSDGFEVIGNPECLKSLVSEAILISRKVHKNLEFCPGRCIFSLNDETLTAKDLSGFIGFVHSRPFEGFSGDEQHSFISIRRLLGNERLIFS